MTELEPNYKKHNLKKHPLCRAPSIIFFIEYNLLKLYISNDFLKLSLLLICLNSLGTKRFNTFFKWWVQFCVGAIPRQLSPMLTENSYRVTTVIYGILSILTKEIFLVRYRRT